MGDISRCYILFIVIMLVCFYKCHMEKLDGVEGSSCVVEGYNGTCLNINKCYQMIKAIAGNIEPKVCSYEGNVPIVCCTECEGYHVKNISNAVFAGTLGILWKNGEKAWDKCLDYISSNRYPCPYDTFIRQRWDDGRKCHTFYEVWPQLLSGGDNVFKGELPHMALLGYGRLLETAQWLCGGSLISETFILTAGHCISSAKLGPVEYAALGILKRSDPPEIWQRYSIKRRIPHPDYKSPRKYHDIALLETASPVKFSWLVLPICLPVGLGDKIHAVAAGWGAVGYMQPLSDGLKQVTVDKFSDEECSDIYQPHRNFLHGYNSTTQMCFGHHILSKDTCEGDSGGPLFYKKGCHFHVIGVTSYGVACGFRGNAGMYTRVDHYVPWIESIVWPSS